jgi:hypothetical protein
VQKQQLDLLLIRKESGPLGCRLPDGFEDLATHNLVTFKSHQDKLSDWALKELVGHYVSHRKQVSPAVDEDKLLPEEEFRLYAVSARYPRQLASRDVCLQPIAEGVYEVQVLTSRIRVIVANEVPLDLGGQARVVGVQGDEGRVGLQSRGEVASPADVLGRGGGPGDGRDREGGKGERPATAAGRLPLLGKS